MGPPAPARGGSELPAGRGAEAAGGRLGGDGDRLAGVRERRGARLDRRERGVERVGERGEGGPQRLSPGGEAPQPAAHRLSRQAEAGGGWGGGRAPRPTGG